MSPRNTIAPASCPFCGEDPPLAAQKIGPSTFTNYIVGCENDDCPANPQVSGRTVERAWALWNTRLGEHPRAAVPMKEAAE